MRAQHVPPIPRGSTRSNRVSKQRGRRASRGQALIIIAGALVALLALVALAVDGSNAFAQRRIAQNAVDGAVTAGASTMQQIFVSNRYSASGQPKVYPISAAQGRLILSTIQSTLTANGASTAADAFVAYYLDANGRRY